MTETIGAIEARLRPARLAADARQSVNAGISRAVGHPAFPVALIGFGAIALAFTAVKRMRRRSSRRRAVLIDDCAVSECAADGLPLSAYAG